MSYELTGTIKLIQEAQTFASGFTKREMVVTVEDGRYPQDINLEFLKDNVSKLDELNEGDVVTVAFNVRGREYNGRYFNTLVGWKVSVDAKGESSGSSDIDEFKKQLESPAPVDDGNGFDDSIPF